MTTRMRHRLGTFLLVFGLGLLAWAATVYLWKDPFTTAYTAYEQRQLDHALQKRFEAWPPAREPSSAHVPARIDVSREARRFRLASRDGDAIARLVVPRMHLNVVVVNGTTTSDLRRGPGRELHTFMPGEGRLVYIAGHRTTYAAPFSHIDDMRPGDRIFVRLPYASITYRVTGHRIVGADDVSVLKSGPREQLVLQACHPRFFATHRYLVYARPVSIVPRSRGA
jgi:sortase A